MGSAIPSEGQEPPHTADRVSRRTPMAAVASLWQKSKGLTVKDITESVSNSGSKGMHTDYLPTFGARSPICRASPPPISMVFLKFSLSPSPPRSRLWLTCPKHLSANQARKEVPMNNTCGGGSKSEERNGKIHPWCSNVLLIPLLEPTVRERKHISVY